VTLDISPAVKAWFSSLRKQQTQRQASLKLTQHFTQRKARNTRFKT